MSACLQFKLLSADAKQPPRATAGSAGLDIASCEATTVPANSRKRVKTGLAMAIPQGFVGLLKGRSSLALEGIDVAAGVIDSDYRGPVDVVLVNHGDSEVQVNVGKRIAQLLLVPIVLPRVLVVDDLDETTRGSGGFGSTGK